jgi:hypothetical protein
MKKQLAFVSACLIALLGFVLMENLSSTSSGSASQFDIKLSNKEFLLLSLTSELENINANLPQQLDPNTLLNSVTIEDEVIVNTHVLTNIAEAELTLDQIKQVIIPNLIHGVCSDVAKRELLNNSINISMEYYDVDRVLIFKTLITQNDCD